MIVVNGLDDTPVLERYELGTSNTTLVGSAVLENFLYTKLTLQLSADQQQILIYGIKKSSTLSDVIQIRSAANLNDIIFEKKYFDEIDDEDIQSYTLLKNNIFATIINVNFSNVENFTQLHNTPNSGNKVSTGGIGDITVFSACAHCAFVAAVGSNLQQVHVINVNTGNEVNTIEAGCDVKLVSLSSEGNLIGHLCTTGLISIYNRATEQTTKITSGSYPTAT